MVHFLKDFIMVPDGYVLFEINFPEFYKLQKTDITPYS